MSVARDAVDAIRGMIASGEVGPGDRLPSEDILSERLAVSRNSMREAVRALEHMGVLEVRHGSGAYVSSLEPSVLLEGISLAVELMSNRSLLEVLEVRQMLEPAATRLAVQRMSSVELDDIRDALLAHDAVTSIEDLIRCDIAFHAAIVRAAGNRTLSSILDGLAGTTVKHRIWGGIVTERAVEATIDSHRQLFSAIESGDAELAYSIAVVHIHDARGWLDRSLAEAPQWDE